MIINIKEIEQLLKYSTAYRIAEDIGGVSRQNLNNYKNGTYNLDQMTIGLATKLQKYYEELENMKEIKVVFATEDKRDSSTYEENIKTYKVDAEYFAEFLKDEDVEEKSKYSEFDFDDYKNWLDNNGKLDETIEVK